MVQLIIEIITFVLLCTALMLNIDRAAQTKSMLANMKVFIIAASIVGMIVYFKPIAQHSFLFIILAILSIRRKNGKQNIKSSH